MNGDKGSKLSFGVSFGMMDEIIDYSLYDGDVDVDNVTVNNFNQRKQYIDGDFRMAYVTGGLTLQGSLLNLGNSFLRRKAQPEANQARLFAAASYKFKPIFSWVASIEPKLVYRYISGFDDIIDIGANFSSANEKIAMMAIYHSAKSASFGLSTKLSPTIGLSGIYTSNTSAMARQTNGNFELNLKVNLFQ